MKNPVPKPQRLPSQKTVSIPAPKRLVAALPPNIHDETVFPPLTRKVEYLQPAWSVPPFGIFFNTQALRSLNGINKPNVIQSTTSNVDQCNNITNQVDLNKQQKETKAVDSVKEETVEEPLDITMERKLQLKEKSETDSISVANENKGLWPENSPNAADYTEQSQMMVPTSSCDETKEIQTYTVYIDLHDPELYRYMLRYVPSVKCLEDLGYPLASVRNCQPTDILTHGFQYPPMKSDSFKFFERMCDRCGHQYVVYANGKQIYRDNCFYHWGKTVVAQGFQISMTCCGQLPSSLGCAMAEVHVWNGHHFRNGLRGFVTTGFPSPQSKNRVFGLDCEMCYTTEGLELVKVALVDLAGNQVYYSLVIPEHDIVDFNTRFSGVSQLDFLTFKAKPFKKVRKDILNLIKNDTIIIGHGLENDLRALKIIHHLVVDTSIVYRHEHGIPFRRPLKEIAMEVLNANIQRGGHNPVEDANVCVDLILTKLKEDFRIAFMF